MFLDLLGVSVLGSFSILFNSPLEFQARPFPPSVPFEDGVTVSLSGSLVCMHFLATKPGPIRLFFSLIGKFTSSD